MSVAPLITRGRPSTSKAPLAALVMPALMVGDPAASAKLPAAALTNRGAAVCFAVAFTWAPEPVAREVEKFDWRMLTVATAGESAWTWMSLYPPWAITLLAAAVMLPEAAVWYSMPTPFKPVASAVTFRRIGAKVAFAAPLTASPVGEDVQQTESISVPQTRQAAPPVAW